jgi:uncharacterized membrane protein
MDTPAEGSAATARANNNLTYLVLAGVAVAGIIFAFSGSALLPNNWYSLFKAIHVTFSIVWVGGGVGIMIYAIRVLRTSEPKEVLSVATQAAFMGEKIFAPAGLIVFLMGIAMMINTNWGWGHFWVIIGLLGYAATFAVGVAVLSPLAKKIEQSAREKGPEHPETMALIERIMLIGRIDVGVLLIVILDMVTKPFA